MSIRIPTKTKKKSIPQPAIPPKNRQRTANYEGDCNDCYKYIAQDDPVWFNHWGKILCTTCASKEGIVCPRCNGRKQPYFEICWECKQEDDH